MLSSIWTIGTGILPDLLRIKWLVDDTPNLLDDIRHPLPPKVTLNGPTPLTMSNPIKLTMGNPLA